MPVREMALYALMGLLVWLQGVVMFRFGGGFLLDSGPVILCASAVVIGLAVCLLLRAAMTWRKTPPALSVTVAVAMTLPGLFGDAAVIAAFTPVTGLRAALAAPYGGVILFGNAVLLAYALVRATRSPAP